MAQPVDEPDVFWRIALEDQARSSPRRWSDSDDEMDADSNEIRRYQLSYPSSSDPLVLQLAHLPLDEGAWSLVGAQAWYGSALLTALIVSSKGCLQEHLVSLDNVVALELGSGAVALPGLALAGLLQSKAGCHRVMLSDNEPAVLRQLEANVECNREVLSRVSVTVQHLDWADELALPDTTTINLVIGSELVYTKETGQACAAMVTAILRLFPQALAIVVQVADRDGFDNVFLPTLSQTPGLQVKCTPLTDPELHSTAAHWIPPGGTLDLRADFILAEIRRR